MSDEIDNYNQVHRTTNRARDARASKLQSRPLDRAIIYVRRGRKHHRLPRNDHHADAQALLGYMYAEGEGVPQDYVRAHMWFSLSVAQGNQIAARDRDNITKRMTPAQIAEAQKLAREWRPGD